MSSRRRTSRWIGACLAALMTAGISQAAFAQDELHVDQAVRRPAAAGRVPDELVVRFKAGVSEPVIRQVNGQHGTRVLSTSRRARFKRLRIPAGRRAEELATAYRRNPNVEYAEPNFIASSLLTPNDPYYRYQWHLDNLGTGGIRMQSAWGMQAGGSSSVIVAIVDTGVAYEDFGTAFKQAPDLAQTTFVPGYDFVANDAHPNDENSHGTHVTGTVAQRTNNGLGVAGVAFQTAIMPVRVLDQNGFGSYTDIAEGIYFATDHGANVISLSLGGPDASITLENAVKYAYDHGVTVVAAAGNDGAAGSPSYPAAYDPYVIAVAATRYDEAVSSYSTRGSYVDVAAPGGDTSVDQNLDGYGDGVLQQTFNPTSKNPSDFSYWFFQGTSMATPHVSGLAALLLANGLTGPDAVREAIEQTARDRGPAGWDTGYGWGLIDAYAALNYVPAFHDLSVTQVIAPGTVLQGDHAALSVEASNPGTFAESFIVTVTDATSHVVLGSQGVSLPPGGSQSIPFTWDTAGVAVGLHTLVGEASSVPEEANTGNNSASTASTVQAPAHDVAVTGLDAPDAVTVGDPVAVQVTVANSGTFAESTTVTLTDETAGVTIGSQPANLSAGASSVMSFSWVTTGATPGSHLLRAVVNAVIDEANLGDNQLTATVDVQPLLAFKESSGQVVMEAEHADANISRQGHDWLLKTSQTGYAGIGYLQVLPNIGANQDTGYVTASPELVYRVSFTNTGTYYVWLRGSAASGSDDSVHAGIDGTGPSSADRIGSFTGGWIWKRNTMDNSAPAKLVITTPGLHTIHLWMREDGLRVDKLLLRKSSSSAAPSGKGPAESPRTP